ncbi:MAG: hypothetical protein U0165_10045 [Polyangiaceae bacterium]
MNVSARAMSVLETVTVGLPFSAFKALFGLWCASVAGLNVLGVTLGLIALVDLGFNLVNLVSLAISGKRAVAICFVSWVLGRLRPTQKSDNLGAAIDTVFAFSLVAIAVGAGFLRTFAPLALSAWNFAVVVNVLGAGLSRLASELSPAS